MNLNNCKLSSYIFILGKWTSINFPDTSLSSEFRQRLGNTFYENRFFSLQKNREARCYSRNYCINYPKKCINLNQLITREARNVKKGQRRTYYLLDKSTCFKICIDIIPTYNVIYYSQLSV